MKIRGKYLDTLHYHLSSICVSSQLTQQDLHYKQISIIRISLIFVAIIKRMVRSVVECSPSFSKWDGSCIHSEVFPQRLMGARVCRREGCGVTKRDNIPTLMVGKF